MQPPGQSGEGDGTSWAMLVAICSVIVNAVGLLVGGIWTLARTKNSTDEKVAERRGEIATDIIALKADIAADIISLERRLEVDIDTATQRFGETVTALRSKVTETELWNRDNFVSKATFQAVIGDIKRSWERFEDKLSLRLDSIDEKLDQRNKSGLI